MTEHWHSLAAEEVIKKLSTSRKGLSDKEASDRIKEHGENRLLEFHKINPFKIFISQFNSFLIYILLAASGVSLFLGHVLDFSIIIAIVILNAGLGFIQEYKAEKAIQNLRKVLIPKARVLRNNKLVEIPAYSIVPGDILVFSEGDSILADARIIESYDLEINEAVLTGESMPVDKLTNAIQENSIIAERENMVFLGTSVERGSGKAVVTSTGMSSEFGKIAGMLQEPEEELTPLQKKLDKLSKQIGIVIISIMAVFTLVGILAGISTSEMFLTSVSLAVAAIPEGLVAAITISLAFAVKRMVKVNSLVRKLPAVETLGRVTVICSDKTGTITKEELKVAKIFSGNKAVHVDKNFLSLLEKDETAQILIKVACLSSNARVELTEGKENYIGDPTEKALVKFATYHGFSKKLLTEANPRLKEFPFNSERKMMSIIRKGNSGIVSYAKGSPEAIIRRCNKELVNGKVKALTDARKKELLKEYEIMAAEALRVLAFAYKNLSSYKKELKQEEAESLLTFVGLQGMFDAPREGVKEAVEKCQNAGISVKMITGDAMLTAKAVAKVIGLRGSAMTGSQLKALTDEELEKVIDETAVFARTDPADKVRIVSLLRKRKEIVALTGDGVNDAPALKKSDIGIAMGIRGSDVTRDVADIILLDDNFSTIINAVEEGRRVYDNIKKFTYYLLSSNLAEVFIIFLALMIGKSLGWAILLPLLPLQILWINLVTDGVIAITLSGGTAEENIMKRKPESTDIIHKKVFLLLLAISVLITIPVLIGFALYQGSLLKEETIAFTLLVFLEGFNALNFSSLTKPFYKSKKNYLLIAAVLFTFMLQLALIYIPPLQQAFHTTSLTMMELGIITLVSASILIAGEVFKIAAYSRNKK